MTVINNQLTPRERRFCLSFLRTGDASLAARLAGFRNPATAGERLLCSERVSAALHRLSEVEAELLHTLAVTGYRRLAFGSAADAVSLLYRENPSREELADMDLFSVSEIKRPKDGAMELKFFDRAKALERLAELSRERETGHNLFDAIGSAAGSDSDD
ncbi:MAG: terminase small subunit [Ruminococcus sp.]|nr:terminase small subunit [Ruminococcus sp.]